MTGIPWLLAGGVLVCFTFMRFSVPALGWIVFAPFLVFLHTHRTLRAHLALLLTLLVAFLLAVWKIVTSEIPWPIAPMFAAPIALSYFIALSVAGGADRRIGTRWGAYTFAATTVVLGWIQYAFTSGASWGVLAHTQLDNLPLLQLAAWTGLGGITFLVALGSGLSAAAWNSGVKAVRVDLAALGLAVAAATLYGQVRLAEPAPGPLVRVGGVVSPMTHKEFGEAMADVESVRRLDDELFARSGRAVDLGARIVVWNEISTLTTVAGEPALTARAQAFARDRGVLLVMAYGIVESMQPFFYINKYRIYLPDGTMADQYVKRFPVPGDPNPAGTAHAKVIPYMGIRVVGAICYDYSFPVIARDNANDGGDIALVPSSDWRGIDPQHARMAMLNAVAAGLPLMRPVRASTSIATDQFGRLLGTLRFDEVSEGVLVVAVPAQRVPTLYARTGEVVPLVALAFLVSVVVQIVRQRIAKR